MEAVVAWVSKNAACKSHDVTLISARCSSAREGGGVLPSNLNIIETIEPSWEGTAAEEVHYLTYKELLEVGTKNADVAME